jgi:hypothetical protein
MVGFGDRALRVIDKACLQRVPCLRESQGIRRRERHNLQAGNAVFAGDQFRFGPCAASELGYSQVIFRPEASFQAS